MSPKIFEHGFSLIEICQAWAGLHFNVITHKVLHSSKIPAEFLYEFFAFFKAFFTNFLMNLAVGQNDCYLCYIVAIWEGPLCVTAKLIEMAQYSHPPLNDMVKSLNSIFNSKEYVFLIKTTQ